MAELNCSATDTLVRYVPEGPDRDELLTLLRIAVKFRQNQAGKKPGALARLVLDCTRRAGSPYSFAQLLDEMELSAARRELRGEKASPIEKVDRIWQLVTIHLPKRGRMQVPFATIRNHLTSAKKILRAEIPVSRKTENVICETATGASHPAKTLRKETP